ncbi:hypothetical protein GALMADRAFT_144478 [Galerina marginata CBS 339.88]|uniref:F-box domain-containing protein n=1 Tax=Galerina marginata (strain CBS 339.88) TaxID=685588 RepID=A0A067SSC2_GALM3|nr:hypothetical protein GALMADRAFT_144478 [Galerina marginata CBS 339.88]
MNIQKLSPEVLNCIFEMLPDILQKDHWTMLTERAKRNAGLYERFKQDSVDSDSDSIAGVSLSAYTYDESADREEKVPTALPETSFPAAVARVCRQWSDILSKHPEYWENIVFDLRENPNDLINCFSWTEHLGSSIRVSILAPTEVDTKLDPITEQSRVSRITRALVPHIHRCLSIDFAVTHVSSLPPLPLIYQHASSSLLNLKLSAKQFEVVQTDLIGNQPITTVTQAGALDMIHPTSSAPTMLSDLVLHSEIFISLTQKYHDWLQLFVKTEVELFAILDGVFSSPANPSPNIRSIAELLEPLDQLFKVWQGDLILEDISVLEGNSPLDPDTDLICSITAKNLLVSKSNQHFWSSFFALAEVAHDTQLVIMDTIFPSMPHIIDVGYVELVGIGPDSKVENFFEVWDGDCLLGGGCSCFTDSALDILSNNTETLDAGKVYGISLSVLILKGCTGFTSTGLRKFIERRIGIDNLWSPLADVLVTGDLPVILANDREWFSENLGGVNCHLSWIDRSRAGRPTKFQWH